MPCHEIRVLCEQKPVRDLHHYSLITPHRDTLDKQEIKSCDSSTHCTAYHMPANRPDSQTHAHAAHKLIGLRMKNTNIRSKLRAHSGCERTIPPFSDNALQEMGKRMAVRAMLEDCVSLAPRSRCSPSSAGTGEHSESTKQKIPKNGGDVIERSTRTRAYAEEHGNRHFSLELGQMHISVLRAHFAAGFDVLPKLRRPV